MPATARINMIKSQILTGNVLQPSLTAAIEVVERERFVPESHRGNAYVDDAVALGHGRFLMEPLAFARMVEHAAITPQDSVLTIGSGTGYSAAVLSRMARRVVAVESIEALAVKARELLVDCPNVSVVNAPLFEGEHTQAPYDVILVEGAIEYLPQAIADQVREGGRIIVCESAASARTGTSGLSKIVRLGKRNNVLYRTVLGDANVQVLAEFKKPAGFTL